MAISTSLDYKKTPTHKREVYFAVYYSCYTICVGSKLSFRSVWVRLGLGVLGYTAVLLILTWLLHQYLFLKNSSTGDSLFVVGVLACATASVGMFRSPYGEMLSPWGVTAHPVEPTEAEKRARLVADFVEQRSFGVRLLAAGLLTIVMSVLFTYVIKL